MPGEPESAWAFDADLLRLLGQASEDERKFDEKLAELIKLIQAQTPDGVGPWVYFSKDDVTGETYVRVTSVGPPPSQDPAHLFDQPLGREEIEAVAPIAEETIEHTLARMFMRLGPPPEPTELDYTPSGSGGGGAQQ
ncbi:hypothetical protein ACWGQ5_34415 [Streptomyces sp. NPDC055722]